MTMKEASAHPDWRAAWAQAAAELHLPARGARGGPENAVRMTLTPYVNVRALQILERGELQEVPRGQVGDNPQAVR